MSGPGRLKERARLMELRFRPFSRELELAAQRRLFVECFPENIGTPVETVEHYAWKFGSAPAIPPSYEYGAYLDDELVGYYAALPYRYNYFSTKVTAGIVCDVMTGAKARGKGVFTKLGSYANDELKRAGVDFSCAFPIREIGFQGHIKAGLRILFDLPLYARFLRFDSYFKKKGTTYLLPLFRLGVGLQKLLLRSIPLRKKGIQTSSYSSRAGISSIPGLLDFLQEWQKELPISLVKDRDFMTWRTGAPGQEYFVTIVKHEDKIVGYALYRFVIKEGVPCVGILDLSLLNGCHHLSRFLFREIVRFAEKSGAEFIFVMMSKLWAGNYRIRRSGFLRTRYRFRYILKKLNMPEADQRHEDLENWHLMWIDSDDL